MSAKIIGIVTGSVLVLVVIALFCFANKERWMLLFSQSRSTLQHDPESLPSEPALAQSNHQPQGTSENREVAGCAEITETTAEIGTKMETSMNAINSMLSTSIGKTKMLQNCLLFKNLYPIGMKINMKHSHKTSI